MQSTVININATTGHRPDLYICLPGLTFPLNLLTMASMGASLFPWLNQCAMQADMLLRNTTTALRFSIDLVHCQAGDAASNHGKNDHATLLEYA